MIIFTATGHLYADDVQHVEPTFWWVGMKNPKLQLLVHGENISQYQAEINYPGVTLRQVIQVESPNYLFLDLIIGTETQPGSFSINFKNGKRVRFRHQYELKAREAGSSNREGIDGADAIYLITPDRFVNGDPSNDNVEGMKERADRQNPDGRHGGDIQGIMDRLDYIKDMGFNAIWLNPLLENNMPEYSYHGYSTTDYYRIDARFGSNEQYRLLAETSEAKGIGLIMDMIANHCGSEHWWMADLPTTDWINFDGRFVQTNHQKSTIQDPYVSDTDHRRFVDGWFVKTMPDLNQRNPLVANYLIQNSIWWIEYAHLTGIRQDTYPYPDMHFMTEWTCRIRDEYPNFYIVGEEWNGNPAIVAHWQQGKKNPNGYTSCLPGLMDFPLQEALRKGLTENEKDWGQGWIKTYEMLANDFQYADPFSMVVFPDNHDMDRFYTQLGEDLDLFKLGLAYTLTMRGIPQIYYGTEVLMVNRDGGGHGIIRSDFPGGWAQDNLDVVSETGLSEDQVEAKKFVKKLLTWRKDARAVHHGRVLHYLPSDGVYVYFRIHEYSTVMVVLNKNDQNTELILDRFAQGLENKTQATDIISNRIFDLATSITVPARSPLVLELK